MEQRVDNIETWLKWLLRGFGVTLVGLLAFAFWLGTISNEVSSAKQMSAKVYSSVMADPNSLMVRTDVIEHRLTQVETRLTKVENKLEVIDARLTSMDTRLASLDLKMDTLLSGGRSRERK
jgi:uncharacterized coiled-coil protein SlyX